MDFSSVHQNQKSSDAARCRCTRQRWAVYSFLSHAEGHPTADEVYHAVKGSVPKISLATVYKSLEALVTSGLGVVNGELDPDCHAAGKEMETGGKAQSGPF